MADVTEPLVLYECRDRVATITFNRPARLNAFNDDMAREALAAMHRFDLDPDASISWKTLAASALDLRQRLKKLGLKSFLKSTGGKGLHIVVPIEPTVDWARAKQFAHDVALEMEKENPSLYITKMTKAARKNRIYLDYLRNDRESTAIAPWSPRARAGAPVAMPLDWKELEANEAPSLHVGDLPQWQHRLQHDPWKAIARVKQRIADAGKK